MCIADHGPGRPLVIPGDLVPAAWRQSISHNSKKKCQWIFRVSIRDIILLSFSGQLKSLQILLLVQTERTDRWGGGVCSCLYLHMIFLSFGNEMNTKTLAISGMTRLKGRGKQAFLFANSDSQVLRFLMGGVCEGDTSSFTFT